MTTTFASKCFPRFLVQLVYEVSAESLEDPESTEIAIPHDHIATAAYFRFVERGFAHGYDVCDWVASETELHELCKQLMSLLRDQQQDLECSEYDEKTDCTAPHSNDGVASLYEPISSMPGNLPPTDASEFEECEMSGWPEQTKTQQSDNVWVDDQPIRSAMKDAEFQARFGRQQFVVIEITSDKIFLAGNSEHAIDNDLALKGYSPGDFQVESVLSEASLDWTVLPAVK